MKPMPRDDPPASWEHRSTAALDAPIHERDAASIDAAAFPKYEPGGVVFDVHAYPDALWGEGGRVLAAKGEPTIIYASTGMGKTTLAQRIGLAAIGLGVDVGRALAPPPLNLPRPPPDTPPRTTPPAKTRGETRRPIQADTMSTTPQVDGGSR